MSTIPRQTPTHIPPSAYGLPDRVTAALADDGPDGWRIYRLEDTRGYTHARDTIRVGRYNAVDGRVERMTRDGWTHLFAVRVDKDGYVDQGEAVRRAVAVLYGMEKHG